MIGSDGKPSDWSRGRREPHLSIQRGNKVKSLSPVLILFLYAVFGSLFSSVSMNESISRLNFGVVFEHVGMKDVKVGKFVHTYFLPLPDDNIFKGNHNYIIGNVTDTRRM